MLLHSSSIHWPAGTEALGFENLEGLVLLKGTLRGRLDADTTGPLALDTGAGYLALDHGLAGRLGLADSAGAPDAVRLTDHPLPRLTLGGWILEQIDPVLTVDGEVIRRVSDRPVLGLLGQAPLGGRIVWIDYREQVLAMIPGGGAADTIASVVSAGTNTVAGESLRDRATPAPAGTARERATHATGGSTRDDGAAAASLSRSRAQLAEVLSSRAIAVRFLLVGDGKILIRGAVADPSPPDFSRRLNLIVDTGATKCVLFEDAIATSVRHADRWPALRGLAAPTLIGSATARIARIPVVELETARGPLRETDVDVGVIRSDLSQVLSRVTHETIHGLIGYSLLKRFRLAIDYPDRVLWLDPIPGYRDDRPLEYCHVGLQLERRAGAVVVTGVVEDSPAAHAGISPGDELMALDGIDAATADLIDLIRHMEGEPGRSVTLVLRRSANARTVRLVRRRLL